MTASATLTNIEAGVKHWATFVAAHEKMFIIIAFAFLSFYFGNAGLKAWEAHDQRNATIAQQKVTADATLTAKDEQQLSELKAQVAIATLEAEAAKAAAHANSVKHIIIDKTLPPQPLADRWTSLATLQPGDVKPNPDQTFTVSNQAAHTTVEQLEKIPDLTTALGQTNVELQGCKTEEAKAESNITDLKKQFTDEHAARVEDAKLAAVKQKKSWLRGFKWGFVAGVASTVAIRLATL
jgi:hypothetical protein